MDLRRERDLEQLRRIAFAQQVQIEQLLRVLQAKCEELQALKGNPAELQQTLALVEALTKQQQAAHDAGGQSKPATPQKTRKKRESHGPTAQPELPHLEQLFELDEADRVCPCCGGELRPIDGQFEESEMIDVVEVSYRVVKVKQQKYNCRYGGALETAPVPTVPSVAGATLSRLRSRSPSTSTSTTSHWLDRIQPRSAISSTYLLLPTPKLLERAATSSTSARVFVAALPPSPFATSKSRSRLPTASPEIIPPSLMCHPQTNGAREAARVIGRAAIATRRRMLAVDEVPPHAMRRKTHGRTPRVTAEIHSSACPVP